VDPRWIGTPALYWRPFQVVSSTYQPIGGYSVDAAP